MAKQSEQILEEQLIVQLQKLGYQYVSLLDDKAMLVNLKAQLEKHNNISFTSTEFEKVSENMISNAILDAIADL